MDVSVELFLISFCREKSCAFSYEDISKKKGKFEKDVEEKMSKSLFTINQLISSVIINVDFAGKDGWKGDIIFNQSKKIWNEQMIN